MKKVLSAKLAQDALRKFAKRSRAVGVAMFFKTGKGEYGEGDKFIGVSVPNMRIVAREFRDLKLSECLKLLRSKIHEHRAVALIILVDQFRRGDDTEKKRIFDLYIKNFRYVNNWDLVDLSAPHIVGAYLYERKRTILFKLSRSKNLWERRISILATFYFIRQNDFADSLKIAEILLHDEHDLIHKAVGWMLREIGNRDSAIEHKFLCKYQKVMPRTMLRYSIEKFSAKRRREFLEGRAK